MPLDIAPDLRGGRISGTLEELCSRYPVVTDWLLGVRIDPRVPAPVTVPATRMIHVPPHLVRLLEDDCKHGLSQVTAHEFAHALMLAAQLEAVGRDMTQLVAYSVDELLTWRDRTEESRNAEFYNPPSAISEIVGTSKASGLEVAGFGEQHLNEYGCFDDLEFFAEAMRAYWTHEQGDGPLAPMVETIGLGIDARYLRRA